jgi:hypothetical protein
MINEWGGNSGAPGPSFGNLLVDATTMYFVYGLAPNIGVYAIPLTSQSICESNPNCGSDPLTAIGTVMAGNIVVDAANLYWVGATASPPGLAIMQCAKVGCAGGPTPLAPVTGPTILAADGQSVYWIQASTSTTSGGIMKCAATGCGGQPTMVISASVVSEFAVDGTSVYWADGSSGNILRCPNTGCNGPPVVLAAGQMFYPGGGWDGSFAVDANNVYWEAAVQGGAFFQVFKVAK